jgi:hypothetical protein
MADGALSYLFGANQPSNVDSSTAASNGLPTWYQQYLSGIAGKATQVAGAQDNMPIPAQSVAGFNGDQTQAFQQVRDNQGSWQPAINAATGAASSIVPGATNLVGQAQSAVSGPAQTWDTTQAQKYMSPYTSQVVDNIQRLGLRNLNENLLPAVQDQFIGSGQFGSTRNSDILGRTVRDANTDISGQVGNALNAGYTNAQTAFTSDANRAQQQQQLQGSTALQGAGALTTAGAQGATTLGALGQTTQALGNTDAATLNASGTQQQALDQQGLNTNYTNATNANNFDWNNLNNLNSVVRGLQLPQTAVQTTNQPATPSNGMYSGSAVSGIGALASTFNNGKTA